MDWDKAVLQQATLCEQRESCLMMKLIVSEVIKIYYIQRSMILE